MIGVIRLILKPTRSPRTNPVESNPGIESTGLKPGNGFQEIVSRDWNPGLDSLGTGCTGLEAGNGLLGERIWSRNEIRGNEGRYWIRGAWEYGLGESREWRVSMF